tara:strand:- start:163 stop:303 length:141 start_codon:yes stop_codon:yes gene_type:complete
MKKFFDWHEKFTWKMVDKMRITDYQALWFAWFEGLLLGAILIWLMI